MTKNELRGVVLVALKGALESNPEMTVITSTNGDKIQVFYENGEKIKFFNINVEEVLNCNKKEA